MELSQQAPPCCVREEKKTQSKVMELLQAQRQAVCTYSALAGCVRGELRRRILSLAHCKQRMCAKLETVFYLVSGQKAQRESLKRPPIGCAGETLRSQYILQIQAVQKYRELAEEDETFAEVFRELVMEEEKNARELLCVLQLLL